jgi:collagenase-like PrtC family protease
MKLTLGPLLYHWPEAKRRDFYFRIADEAPVDCVHLGEVVCSKRSPLSEPHLPQLIDRLRAAGKEVVLSTLALVTSPREIAEIEARCDAGYLVEANDLACIHAIAGRPHVVGPFVNVFNEAALSYVARLGAVRLVPPPEVSEAGIAVFARQAENIDIEVMAFGRQTLSVAARCYHARSRGRTKDNCQFACEDDPDGLPVRTLDGQLLMMVNGTGTMAHGYLVLLPDLARLAGLGVRRFRLMPQDLDMVAVARLYRDVIDGRTEAGTAMAGLHAITGDVPFVNGYLRGREGLAWVARAE